MTNYTANQIVKGKKAGVFLILGFRTIDNVSGVQVKSVNPRNHSQTAQGEMFLPLDAIEQLV